MGRLNRLTTERSATVILFLLVVAMAARVSGDADLWWHLRSGQTIAETRRLVYPDPFSHTFAGLYHWNHSAFSDLLLFAIWRQFDFAGLIVATALMACAGMAFLFATCRGSAYARAFLIVLGAATAAVFWSPRPQMLSFLFAAILLWLLRGLKLRGTDRSPWVMPLLLIWCNAHGGYIIAYLLLGAFILGEALNAKFGLGENRLSPRKMRKLLLLTVASMPLLALNPLGLRVYLLPFSTVAMPELRRYIQEWQPPDFSQAQTWGFVILLALLIAAIACSKRKLDITEAMLLCGAVAMALYAARNISLFAIVATPIAADHIDEIFRRRGWRFAAREYASPARLGMNLSLIILVALGLAAHLSYVLSPATMRAALQSRFPVAALEQMPALGLPGNMFNSYNWGGYLMWHAPEHPVFIDGRSDLYRSFLDEYYLVATAQGEWRLALDRWRIGFALVESASGLARALAGDQAWQTVYQDQLASIFRRRVPLENG